MGDIRCVEVAPLRESGIARGVEEVRCVAVVVSAPLVEVVSDVVGRWVRASVLKVYNYDLRARRY